jgi:hypothetical protein
MSSFDISTLILGSLLFIITTISFILSLKILKMRKKIKLILASYAKIQELLSLKYENKDNDVHKESFIKFLSDSRESAYEYIEMVQKGLAKFVSDVDSSISYFDEYGDVLSKNRPDYDALKKISSSYKELKKLLPDNENEPTGE